MQEINVPISLDSEECIPTYGSSEAAGADLKSQEERTLAPGESAMIATGVRLELPIGFEVQVRPRSGLAAKHGITVLNTPGTIDSDYRGEIKVILINHSKEPFHVTKGMRIAQAVIAPVYRMKFVREAALSATERGEGGFGHTGY